MTQQDSATIMDAIFASTEEEGRARLLKIMQDFLISESEKHTAKEKGRYRLPYRRSSAKV
jgi:cohesin loading factor subunit SCC2